MENITERLQAWKSALRLGWLKMLAGLWLASGSYDHIASQFLTEQNLPSISNAISWWDWKMWLVGLLVIVIAATVEGFYRMVRELRHRLSAVTEERDKLNNWHVRIAYHDVIVKNVEENSENVSFTGTVDGRQTAGTLRRVGMVSLQDWLDKCANALVDADQRKR